jgi:hypothetical protein
MSRDTARGKLRQGLADENFPNFLLNARDLIL